MDEESEKRRADNEPQEPTAQTNGGAQSPKMATDSAPVETDAKDDSTAATAVVAATPVAIDSAKGDNSNSLLAARLTKPTSGGSAINITISNGEIRSVVAPVVCTQPSTVGCAQMGRAIAPKPIAVAAIPKLEAIGSTISNIATADSRSTAPPTLLITSNASSQSQIIGTSSANAANAVKLANKTIPMALVPTSDGSQMIAVPLSGLNTSRGKAQVITIPVQISSGGGTSVAVTKGKPTIISGPVKAKMVVNPSKITTTVANSISGNVVIPHTVVATTVNPQSNTVIGTTTSLTLSSNPKVTNSVSLTDSTPPSKPSIVKTSSGECTSPHSPPTLTMVTTVNPETSISNSSVSTSLPPSLTPVAVTLTEAKSSPVMPTKVTVTISGGATQTSNDSDTNDSPPTSSATSVTVTKGTTSLSTTSSVSNITLTSQLSTDITENSTSKSNSSNEAQKSESITNSDFDPINIMDWKDGIGTLPGSHLKFKINEFGTLEMVDDEEAEEIMKKHLTKPSEDKMRRSVTITTSPLSPNSGTTNPVIQVFDPDEIRTCVNCGVKDTRSNFIRQGKFCSQACATSQSTRLRIFKQNSNASLKDPVAVKRKVIKTKNEVSSNQLAAQRALKMRKLSSEASLSNPSTPNPESNNNLTTPTSDRPTRSKKIGKPNFIVASNGNKSKNKFSIVVNGNTEHRTSSENAENRTGSENTENEPVSPSSNSDSVKMSRPSTPSSLSHLSALHQSIFALRASQQHQDAPVAWEKHSKNLLPHVDKIKPSEVLTWTPEKVAQFVSSIPGCTEFGQAFLDELVDGEAFLLLNQPDLVKILGIKLGPAVKIYNSILVIRDNMNLEDA